MLIYHLRINNWLKLLTTFVAQLGIGRIYPTDLVEVPEEGRRKALVGAQFLWETVSDVFHDNTCDLTHLEGVHRCAG